MAASRSNPSNFIPTREMSEDEISLIVAVANDRHDEARKILSEKWNSDVESCLRHDLTEWLRLPDSFATPLTFNDFENPLLIAIAEGRRDDARQMLSEGHAADPQLSTQNFLSPLALAISYNDPQLVDLLLSFQADPNRLVNPTREILHPHQQEGKCQAYFQLPCKSDWITPLILAARKGNLAIVQSLLKAGAIIYNDYYNYKDYYHSESDDYSESPSTDETASGQDLNVPRLLRKATIYPNAIAEAAIYGHFDVLRVLLEASGYPKDSIEKAIPKIAEGFGYIAPNANATPKQIQPISEAPHSIYSEFTLFSHGQTRPDRARKPRTTPQPPPSITLKR